MKTLNAEKAKSRLLSTTTIIVALNLTMSGTRNMLSRAMHKIGSKRARNWALATILWVSSWQFGLYAQQPATLSPKLIAVLNQREK